MDDKSLGAMRKDYAKHELHQKDVDFDPILQFEKWFKEAYSKEGEETNACTLSTLGLDGHPEGRIVLLKFYAQDGFTFYTNYNSLKGQELANHPFASLTFHWRTLERQVRIRGPIEKVDPLISDDYFNSRPRASRIGAWASPQSTEIENREDLEKFESKFKKHFEGMENIPRPENWGGYLIKPTKIEFWQGRPSRLHDRIVYEVEGNEWKTKRLAP